MDADAFEALRRFIITTRHERNLSQDDVARRGGVPRGTLGAIESGRSSIPRQETLQGIAKGLGVPYEMLDRLARGLPATVGTTDDQVATILKQIDGLRLTDGHRRMLKRALKSMIEDLEAEEAEK